MSVSDQKTSSEALIHSTQSNFPEATYSVIINIHTINAHSTIAVNVVHCSKESNFMYTHTNINITVTIQFTIYSYLIKCIIRVY